MASGIKQIKGADCVPQELMFGKIYFNAVHAHQIALSAKIIIFVLNVEEDISGILMAIVSRNVVMDLKLTTNVMMETEIQGMDAHLRAR